MASSTIARLKPKTCRLSPSKPGMTGLTGEVGEKENLEMVGGLNEMLEAQGSDVKATVDLDPDPSDWAQF